MENTNDNLINDDEYVTVINCGRYREIICCRQKIKNIATTKINQTQYIDNKTGEVKEYRTFQGKSLENFKKSFKNIPRLINGYFDGNCTERFITLTYAIQMTNPYNLSNDFKKFIRKVERHYCKCRYIYIKEPQENGSWHIHGVIKRLDERPFNISIDKVRSLWNLGYAVSVEIPYNISTIFSYFDISEDDNKKARISYYPSQFNIYGYSRDMKISKCRDLYKNVKPLYAEKIYQTENEYFIVNEQDGEITGHWKTAYEQYMSIS